MGAGSRSFNKFGAPFTPYSVFTPPQRSFGGFGYESGPAGIGLPGPNWGAAAAGVGGQGVPSGFPQKALDWVLKNPDALLAGVSMISNARRNAKADKLRQQALKTQQARAKETAELRKKMIAELSGMDDVAAPRVSLRDPNNPYGR